MLKRLTVVDDLEAWIAALRSGKYRQCRGAAQKGKAFCAYGLLAELLYTQDARFNAVCRSIEDAALNIVEMNDCMCYSFKHIAACIEHSVLKPLMAGTAPGLGHLYPPMPPVHEVE